MTECVILLHGMFRNHHDMDYLAEGLQKLGYHTLAPTLPTTFGHLSQCVEKLERFLEGKLDGFERIHFVAHSMGGMIERTYLGQNRVPNLGRCVLIGVPNHGVDLAKSLSWAPFLRNFIRTLPVLVPPGPSIKQPLNTPPPEVGVIGGTVNKGVMFGFLFGEKSDGRVPIASAPFEGAKETVWLPLNHHDIHHNPETLKMIDSFLKTGSFRESKA